jgi:hypothetical protein
VILRHGGIDYDTDSLTTVELLQVQALSRELSGSPTPWSVLSPLVLIEDAAAMLAVLLARQSGDLTASALGVAALTLSDWRAICAPEPVEVEDAGEVSVDGS